jgi:serine phosphatase RsbU (regulator of sigma subunit)
MMTPKIAIFGLFLLYLQTSACQVVAQDERGFVSGSAVSNTVATRVGFTEMIALASQSLTSKNYEKAYIEFKIAFKDIHAAKHKDSKDVNWQAINNDFGKVCDTLGTRLLYSTVPNASVKYFVEAVIPYFNAENQDAIFGVTQKMAQVSLKNASSERYDNAIKKYQDFLMYAYRKRITDIELIGNAHFQIASLLLEKGSSDTALVSLKEASILYKNPIQKIVIYKRLADFYKYLREQKGLSALIYEEATVYFKQEIEQTQDHELQANLYLMKADFELKRGKTGSFFKDYTSAINLFQEDNNPVGAAQTCIKAAQMLYEAAEYNKAKAYLDEGKKIISKVSNKELPEVKQTVEQLKRMVEDVQRREKLDSMKGESNTLDEQLEAQQRQYLTVIALFLTSALVLVGISFYNARKSNVLLQRKNMEIHEQKEQISVQHENIVKQKDELETSYRNISLLSEIGQKITATLDLSSVVHLVHECFSNLVSTDVFGVGVYHATFDRVNFLLFSENGQELADHTISLQKDGNQNFANCIKGNKELLVNGQMELYVMGQEREVMQSQLFLPLVVNNQVTGLITVQSKNANAYSKRDLNLLKALASYTSVALANANAYQIIENKNKSITDSLRYGKTIQQALLPSKERLENAFSDNFVFFRPKDIVSGDFYWHSRLYNKEIIAAVDCTGHGVPGAFMSMIGHTLLNEIVNQHKISEPAHILGLLHNNIRKVLHQSTEDGNVNDDGMDASICTIESVDDDLTKVTFAGAKRPLMYIPKPYAEVRHIRGDRKSIGGLQKEDVRMFHNHELVLPKGSLIYLFSDGYPDQNGTDRGNFTTKKLEHLLLENAKLPLDKQKEILRKELALHQQQAEQRDDITVIGIRI